MDFPGFKGVYAEGDIDFVRYPDIYGNLFFEYGVYMKSYYDFFPEDDNLYPPFTGGILYYYINLLSC